MSHEATVDLAQLGQTFLTFLSDPYNRTLSIEAQCLKLGLSGKHWWYKLLRETEFRIELEKLGIVIKDRPAKKTFPVKRSNQSEIQQRLWQVLQFPENRQLGVRALCAKAGFNSKTPWYRAIKDENFRTRIAELGVETTKHTEAVKLGTATLKAGQLRFLKVLEHEANRNLPTIQLAQLAGYTSHSSWRDALRDPQFRKLVQELGVAVERKPIKKEVEGMLLNQAQLKMWELLQNEENRTLPPWQLCKKAGYRSSDPWYDAIKDPQFREAIEALGVKIRAIHKASVGPVPLASNVEEVWQHDQIDLRQLLPDYPKHNTSSRYRLDFSFITNFKLRQLIKKYFRARLNFWEAGTFKGELYALKAFLVNLSKTYPELESFAALNRAMIVPLLNSPYWVDEQGQERPISSHKRNRTLRSLENMFNYMQRREWEGAPLGLLIYEEDKLNRSHRNPRPIPEAVLDQLKANLSSLQSYPRNLVIILMFTGLRSNDALQLKEDCLDYDHSGDPRLHWYNHKMKRDGRPLPVSEEVVKAIQAQRELVRTVPDHFREKYLFRTERGLYRFEHFRHQLRELTDKGLIRGLDGNPYYIQSHQFRHTVGTQMINAGLGIIDVMTYLDHQSPEMTLYYVKLEDDTLKQKFKQLVLSGQAVGGPVLQTLRVQLAQGDEQELDWVVANLRRLSLPWGHCLHHAKATKCPYGQNVCFTKDNGPCHKLVTTPDHAPVIVATLEDLKKSKQAADEKGWQLYANDLADQIKGMEQVLTQMGVPPPTPTQPSNRGSGAVLPQTTRSNTMQAKGE